MQAEERLRIRANLRALGVPAKSIQMLKVMYERPGLTNTELGAATNMTKQAVSKHVNPLETKGIIGNTHPHPLWKAWEIRDEEVKNLIARLLPRAK
jgi:DNA-binding MarR family transcriptional regulator